MIIGKGQYTIADVYDGDSFYRAWADTPDGSGNSFSTTDSNRLYMGVYSGREAPDSYSDYQWTKVRGDSAVVAVLSNDNHQVGTDADGKEGNYTGAETTLTILRGGDIDTDNWKVSVSTFPEESIRGVYSASTFTYKVEEMATDEGQVIFQATPKTGSDSLIEKVFSLSKNKQGQPGEDAKSYQLTVNDTAVKKNRLTRELEPEEVVITGTSITGSGSSQAENGYFKIYTQSETAMRRDDYEDAFYDNLLDPEEAYTLSDNMHPLVLTYTSDQPESELTYTFTDLIDVMSFKVYWYKDSEFEELLDTQTIVVVSDGIDGRSIVGVSEYYLLTDSLERPNQSADWKENEPMTPDGDLPYLWNYETVHYSDGSPSHTLPVILAMYSKDGTSLTDVREYYALSSSKTDQPAEEAFKEELKVTTPEQKYLWNKEVLELTHDDGTITEKVHYAIIGVHGEEGKQGVPGAPGDNGQSQYVHIRYSSNASGNPNSTIPDVNTEYIGLAATFNETESSQTLPYTSYTWSKYRGEDGKDGPAGIPADDNFTWVKYAEDDKGTNMSDFPEGKKYIGLAFNKLTQDESENPNDYQWAAMYDEEGMKNVSVVDKDKVSGTEIYTDKADDSVVHVEIDGKSYQDELGRRLDFPNLEGVYTQVTSTGAFTHKTILGASGYYEIDVRATDDESVGAKVYWQWNSVVQSEPVVLSRSWQKLKSNYFDGERAIGLRVLDAGISLETSNQIVLDYISPDSPSEIHSLNDFDVVSQKSEGGEIDKINLSLSEPLRSVGDVHDRLFRDDSDGLWKVERNVGRILLEGNQTFLVHDVRENTCRVRYSPGVSLLSSRASDSLIKADRFKTEPNSNWNQDRELVEQDGGQISIRINKSRLNGTTSFYANNWFRNNPTEVLYTPSTPTIETLDQELQDKLNNLRSFQNSNYVYTIINDKTDIIAEQLKPRFSATFKGGGWHSRWKTQQELDTKPSYEELGDDTSKVVISGGNITAGTIASQNEYSKIDLDDGSFSFGNGALTWDGGTLRIGKDNSLQSDIDGKATPSYVDGKADDAERIAKQHADAVAKAEAELAEAEAKAYADGKVTAEEQARIDDAEAKLEEAKNHADKVVDDLEVGGRNLFPDSLNLIFYILTHGVTASRSMVVDPLYKDNEVLKLSISQQSNNIVFYWSNSRATLNKGQVYTLSFYIRSDTKFRLRLGSILQADILSDTAARTLDVNNTYQLVSVQFSPTVDDGANHNTYFINDDFPDINLSGATIWMTPIKLEKGNKATDWTPAPEDVESSIGDVDDKATDAKNKTDSWTYSGETTIDGGAIQTDTITATQIAANSITADLMEVDEISALTSKLGDVTAGTITSENGNIHIDLNEGFMSVADGMFKIQGKDIADAEDLGQLDGKIDKEIEHREGFISFEDGIVTIGQKNSPTNIQVKNDRISFMQNGTEVAYITEQTMEITHGIFVETAKIGEHKQETLSGGHTVFTWEG